jgi:hypothetical protein
MTTQLNTGTRTARKRHRCDWCGTFIESGEVYSFWTGIFDGQFNDSKVHMECDAALRRDKDYDPEDGLPEFGSVKRGMTLAESEAPDDAH